MTELDDKLRAIAEQAFYPKGKGYDSPDDFVAAIKQAFAEAGYVQMAYNPVTQEVAGKPIADVLATDNLMTGQEWYARYRDEVLSHQQDFTAASNLGQVLTLCREAARRAAGLTDA